MIQKFSAFNPVALTQHLGYNAADGVQWALQTKVDETFDNLFTSSVGFHLI